MAYPQFVEDLQNIRWFYTWGSCSNISNDYLYKCVPMFRPGISPIGFDESYSGYLLVFNEPDKINQDNLYPEEAVQIYIALKMAMPNAKMIVGNTTAITGIDWLMQFYYLCKSNINCVMPELWGFHGYLEGFIDSQELIARINYIHSKIGGKFWITEWANTNGFSEVSILEANSMVSFLNSTPWIERWAWFTNRIKGDEPSSSWPTYWNPCWLWDYNTGELTNWGAWFFSEVLL